AAQGDERAEPAEELWSDSAEFPKLLGRRPVVFGADHFIDEADGELQAVGVLENAGESSGRGINGIVLRFGEPAAHEGDRLLGEILRANVGTHPSPLRRGNGPRCGQATSGEGTQKPRNSYS